MTEAVKKKRGPMKGWKDFVKPLPSMDTPNGNHSGIDAFFHADDGRIIDRYKNLPLDQAMFELSRLRKIADLAINILNQRAVPDESQCFICKNKIAPGAKVAMMYVEKDESGIQTARPICSVNCVRELHRKKMGWNQGSGIPDQGVERNHLPTNEVTP